MSVLMLLCGFLLYPVTAAGSQPKTLPPGPPTLDPQAPIVNPLSCWDLLPESLPDFNHLAPLPRYLISLALYIPLEQAGCPTDAHNLRQQLNRLGGVKATETLLQQLQGLPRDKKDKKSDWVLFSILQLLGRRTERLGRSGRIIRSLSATDCVSEKEQNKEMGSTDQSWQEWGITPETGGRWKEDYGVSSGKHVADEVTEATSLWNWRSFKIWG
ncbi:apolipoprotein F isoform X1 [Antechinus flavipes]|uniref:apolipoprotein F isoform X1 n=1 Tax=Antechinus flavipes TaxID=38775 RepID=UPI0022369551|nr:apolipoprotein F isoform X1 [Antechinus flavipes]XP_051856247.1 apolipoprotein F isoform X1 [Antechinus flavipes]